MPLNACGRHSLIWSERKKMGELKLKVIKCGGSKAHKWGNLLWMERIWGTNKKTNEKWVEVPSLELVW